jgi:hypothetical protein
MASYSDGNKAAPPTGADLKWRFFWKLRSQSSARPAPDVATEQVVPQAFPHWAKTMDGWGSGLLRSAEIISELLAIGYGLPVNTFTDMIADGDHLLAPTGAVRACNATLFCAQLLGNADLCPHDPLTNSAGVSASYNMIQCDLSRMTSRVTVTPQQSIVYSCSLYEKAVMARFGERS